MTELGRSFVVWVLAFVACLVGTVPAAALGLSVPGEVSLPLATGLGALLAALAAGWAGDFLARDGSRTRLLAVVGVAEVAVALLLALRLGVPLLERLVAMAGLTLVGLLLTGAGGDSPERDGCHPAVSQVRWQSLARRRGLRGAAGPGTGGVIGDRVGAVFHGGTLRALSEAG